VVSRAFLRVSRWEMTSLALERPRKRLRTDWAASWWGFTNRGGQHGDEGIGTGERHLDHRIQSQGRVLGLRLYRHPGLALVLGVSLGCDRDRTVGFQIRGLGA